MDNSRKTPLASTLPGFARTLIEKGEELDGYALPCHVISVDGSIVTIAFDIQTAKTLNQVTIPVLFPEYIRLPIRVGDRGVTIPFDAYLGPSSGQGGSVATLLKPGNLGGLAFLPIGNANWFAVDGDNLVLYSEENCLVQITPTGVQVTGSDGGLSTVGPLAAGNGASGTFTSADGKTITVVSGIITSIA